MSTIATSPFTVTEHRRDGSWLLRALWLAFEIVFYSVWIFQVYYMFWEDWLPEWASFWENDGWQLYNPFFWTGGVGLHHIEKSFDAIENEGSVPFFLERWNNSTGWIHSILSTPLLLGIYTAASSLVR